MYMQQEHQQFAEKILPWIERATGMRRGFATLPPISIAHSQEEMARKSGAATSGGCYDPRTGGITLAGVNQFLPMDYQKSVLVHELVHYLQDCEGLLNPRDARMLEREAYSIQAKFLRDVCHTSDEMVARYGLDQEGIERGAWRSASVIAR